METLKKTQYLAIGSKRIPQTIIKRSEVGEK